MQPILTEPTHWGQPFTYDLFDLCDFQSLGRCGPSFAESPGTDLLAGQTE